MTSTSDNGPRLADMTDSAQLKDAIDRKDVGYALEWVRHCALTIEEARAGLDLFYAALDA